MSSVQTGTIETSIPGRLDRLPWSRFHWRIVFGLGTAWVLDGLEVTMVASVGSRLTQKNAGLGLSVSQIGVAGAIYIVGACVGALFFGQMCDRFGRKKLFVITLVFYIVSTVITAFSFAPWFFFLARFLTGAGIGGEYSAINSAIDELIPARARGRIDLMINGSYWFGSIIGSGVALFFLSSVFPADLGWRLAFGVGAVLGLAVMFVRRKVPESPRWLFIHGREQDAEAIVDGLEQEVEAETGEELAEVDMSITVRQRKTIPFRELAAVAFKLYPRRAVLCIALFVGQAFIYNGVTFNLGTLMTTFFKVSASAVPIFIIIYAVGNLAGPLILGRLFDTVGRKPMISGTYLGSAVLAVVLAGLFVSGSLNSVTFIIVVVAVFFLASSGASAAYLTASEIFPMETRALAIAFFYAVGTAVGGITGPLLFGKLIGSGSKGEVAVAFLIGAGVMALGGLAEVVLGVKAEGKQLEDIAKPLTVGDAQSVDNSGSDKSTSETSGAGSEREDGSTADGDEPDASLQSEAARRHRELAAEDRARAAEHRAGAHEQLAVAGDEATAHERAELELVLAEVAEVTACAHDERAAAQQELSEAEAEDEQDEHLSDAARQRFEAAEQRAIAHDQRAEAMTAEHSLDAERHRALAAVATERARGREQQALCEQARAAATHASEGERDIELARAQMHDAWAQMHAQRARIHQAHSEHDDEQAARAQIEAQLLEERALAAAEYVTAAEHYAEAGTEHQEQIDAEQVQQREQEAEARARDRERIHARVQTRTIRERSGGRRYRPGPGSMSSSRGWAVSSPLDEPLSFDNEIQAIHRALAEHGATERHALAQMVGSRYWGPGVFGQALRAATADGEIRRVSRSMFDLVDAEPGHGQSPTSEERS